MNQMTTSGRVFSELAQCWLEHQTQISNRKEELDEALSKTRETFNRCEANNEAFLKTKQKELR